MTDSKFSAAMASGYAFDGPSLLLGAPLLDGAVASDARVRVPLPMMNRHGLIAGATGTGKTKTLRRIRRRAVPGRRPRPIRPSPNRSGRR